MVICSLLHLLWRKVAWCNVMWDSMSLMEYQSFDSGARWGSVGAKGSLVPRLCTSQESLPLPGWKGFNSIYLPPSDQWCPSLFPYWSLDGSLCYWQNEHSAVAATGSALVDGSPCSWASSLAPWLPHLWAHWISTGLADDRCWLMSTEEVFCEYLFLGGCSRVRLSIQYKELRISCPLPLAHLHPSSPDLLTLIVLLSVAV